MSEGITSVLSALGFLNPGLHLMQTLFIYLNLEQSSQLLRILLITCNFSFTSLWGIQSSQHRVIAWNDVTFPISNNLQVMRDKVLAGSFVDDKSTPRISFSKYVDIDLGTTSPVKKSKGCSCKKGCNKACGCKKKGLRCHSGCVCNGNCH